MSGLEEGSSLGSWVEVMGAGSSSPARFGAGGGLGGALGSGGEVIGAGSSTEEAEPSLALRKLWKPLRLGTRKLYAIG